MLLPQKTAHRHNETIAAKFISIKVSISNVTGIQNFIWFKQTAILWSTWQFWIRLLQIIDSTLGSLELTKNILEAEPYLSATIIWIYGDMNQTELPKRHLSFTVIGYWQWLTPSAFPVKYSTEPGGNVFFVNGCFAEIRCSVFVGGGTRLGSC